MKSFPPVQRSSPGLFPGMGLDAHAVPELTLTSAAALQIVGIARSADALVLEPALERRAAMSAVCRTGLLLCCFGRGLFASDFGACKNLVRQLAHRDLLVWRCLYIGGYSDPMRKKRELFPGKPVSIDFAQKLLVERRDGRAVENGVLSAVRARQRDVGACRREDFSRLENGKAVEASAHLVRFCECRSQSLRCRANLQSMVAHG